MINVIITMLMHMKEPKLLKQQLKNLSQSWINSIKSKESIWKILHRV